MIAKILVSAAFVLGAAVGAAPAYADDTNQSGADPNPFGALAAPVHRTAPPTPGATQELERGMWAGLAG
jgi:hypothetical protein